MDFISRKDGIDKKTIKEYFKSFHANIPGYLARVKEMLHKDQLDFSMEEIDQVGIIYRDNFFAPESLDTSYDELVDIFIAYCSEAWIHHFGGEYHDTLSTKDICYGYPQVINWGPENFGWVGISPNGWAFSIEKGDDDELLSVPYKRNLNRFLNNEEWKFKSKK